jgi:mono/diheme cytochrome c family protein
VIASSALASSATDYRRRGAIGQPIASPRNFLGAQPLSAIPEGPRYYVGSRSWREADNKTPSLGGQPAQYVLIQLFPAPRPADTGDPQRIARGRALADQNHCNICHRSDFTGQQNVPRVADQRKDYLFQTMTGVQDWYTACLRCHHGRSLQPVDDNDLGMLAHFLAHVR